jgi:serine O-acetyltransferase
VYRGDIAGEGFSASRPGRIMSIRQASSFPGRLIDQIREDYRAHGRDWTKPGFRAVAVHRFGDWALGVRPRPLNAVVNAVYRALYRYSRNHYGIELPRRTKVGRRVVIGHQGGIVIHPLAKIGDDCLIRQNVTIGAASVETTQSAPVLMDRVEVGCGAVILGAVVIGDDVRIGPNAVVTMSVPAGSTVVAPPPRVIQVRKPSPPSGVRTDESASPPSLGRDTANAPRK